MRHRPLALLVVCAALTACGGGGEDGSGEPTGNARFAGEYHAFFAKGFDNGGDPTFTSAFGRLHANGAGVITTVLTENEGGRVAGPVPITLLTYEVQADGTLLWFFPAVADEVSWRGALSPRGDLAVLASTRGGSDPEIVVAFRVRAGLTEDSLRGTYFFNGLWAALDDTHIGLVGVGALDIDDPERPLEWSTDEFNVDGAVDTRAHARWGRFSVSDDGGVTHTLVPPFGTGEARGGAYAGGQLVLLGASPLAGHPPELNAFVRREAPPVSAPRRTFAGRHVVVGLQHLADSNQYRSMVGTLTADADGGGSLLFAENVNRRAGSGFRDDISWTHGLDGELEMILEGPCEGAVPCLRGGVTPGGAIAVVGGGVVDGTPPAIYFLLRQ